jgi:hypothetical protein
MGFQVSPGVNVSEVDLTGIIPAVSTTEGALAGWFRWGPAEERSLISSEEELASTFGEPDSTNFVTFFTAANFLSYGNKLYVARAIPSDAINSTVLQNQSTTANNEVATQTDLIKNSEHHDGLTLSSSASLSAFIAKYPGSLGNSLKISVCDSPLAFESTFTGQTNSSMDVAGSNNGFVATMSVGSNTLLFSQSGTESGDSTGQTSHAIRVGANLSMTTAQTVFTVGDTVRLGNSTIGYQTAKIVAKSAVQAGATLSGGTTTFLANILEVWEGLSRASDAKNESGESIYYKDVIDNQSNWVWVGGTDIRATSNVNTAAETYSNTGANLNNYVNSVIPFTSSFQVGSDGTNPNETSIAIGQLSSAVDLFKSPEDVDVSLILAGLSRGGTNGEQWPNYLIDNIADIRKDCVVFCSPEKADVVNNTGGEFNDVATFADSLTPSSYAVMDSGWKYQYDKYNDVYRYIPLNGDIAGLCVRTDDVRDPWFSPAGYNRGVIKNVIKLPYNPDKADRDHLYKNKVNPVITQPGQGTLLFGDKTLLAKPSAFDRINVRRLFIVLEKAIATAAKYTLFEFNDEFTRAQFRNMVEPFLRDVQGRRGIFDFRVVCDETNNTGEVIDANRFVGDIYIKPARAINFIQLNFVAVRTGVEFSEVVGQF